MYDVIIIGAGASGLFCAASHPENTKGLILEKTNAPGTKLLMSGSGQCNFTNAANIKDFLSRYGENGPKIRTALYKFNNLATIKYFEERGVKTLVRDDGKVFPASLRAKDILDVLICEAKAKGFEIRLNSAVDTIVQSGDAYTKSDDPNTVGNLYTVYVGSTKYVTKKLIIATGGCSYPNTGSNGDIFSILSSMGISIVEPKPSLVPIFVKDYPYSQLAGISFENVEVSIANEISANSLDPLITSMFENQNSAKKQTATYKNTGDLLLTHNSFSGPVILDISRYAESNRQMAINYLPGKSASELIADMKKAVIGNKKSVPNFLAETFKIPVRFAEVLIDRLQSTEPLSCPSETAATLSGNDMKRIATLLTCDTFSIENTGKFNEAMATSGGVALSALNLTTFECKKYPRMFIIGEAIDIDGDTGGFNIQFAFSSGYAAANS